MTWWSSMGLDDEGPEASAAALVVAARDGDVPLVTHLLTAGVSPQACDRRSGTSALLAAVESENVEVVRVLVDAGAQPDAAGTTDTTPLIEAARAGSSHIVRALLDAGADPNLRVRGRTAFDVAVWQGHRDIVDALRSSASHPDPVSDPHGNGCQLMRDFLVDSRVPVSYDPRFREYKLLLLMSGAHQAIYYCPWCGLRLPGSLRDSFFDRMAEFGIDYPDEPPPEQFQDDTWWRSPGDEDAAPSSELGPLGNR